MENSEIINNYNYDEIRQYINTRYLCPPETMFRLLEYALNEISHAIKRLALHEEYSQDVCFEKGKKETIKCKNVETTLTVCFKLDQTDSEALNYLYSEIPMFYSFDEK